MNFQLRISRDAYDISGTYNHFANDSQACVVFRHHPDNGCNRIHHHLYFFGYSKSETTARKHLKSQPYYDLSGNPDWALSLTCGRGKNQRPVDLSGAWIYGTTELLLPDAFPWRKNISPARVEELKVLAKHFWCGGVVELNGKSVSKPRDKNQKEDRYEIIETVQRLFKSKHKCKRREDYTYCGPADHLAEYYIIAIEELRARRIKWHAMDLDRYVLPAFMNDEDGKNEFIQGLVRKNLRL